MVHSRVSLSRLKIFFCTHVVADRSCPCTQRCSHHWSYTPWLACFLSWAGFSRPFSNRPSWAGNASFVGARDGYCSGPPPSDLLHGKIIAMWESHARENKNILSLHTWRQLLFCYTVREPYKTFDLPCCGHNLLDYFKYHEKTKIF